MSLRTRVGRWLRGAAARLSWRRAPAESRPFRQVLDEALRASDTVSLRVEAWERAAAAGAAGPRPETRMRA